MDDLYFIRVKDGPVKIGRSSSVKERLRMLQCASPYELVLVGVLKGGGPSEGIFHSMLREHRLRGEWFEWSEKVAAVTQEAITNGRWMDALGLNDPCDWREGSPLYG